MMRVESVSISVGKCYSTAKLEVRKVIEIDGQNVAYVLRGKMAFPSWDRQAWHSASRQTFAGEVDRVVSHAWKAP
jgi:hypothetical protein